MRNPSLTTYSSKPANRNRKSDNRHWADDHTSARVFAFGLRIAVLFAIPGIAAVQGQTGPPRSSPANPAPQPSSAKAPVASRPSAGEQEAQALRQAVSSAAAGDPQSLMKNLEDFLARYPASAERKQVLKVIMHQAVEANDPETALTYGEKLLELDPGDFESLTSVVELLGRKRDPASEAAALRYTTRFIEEAGKIDSQAPPADTTPQKWAATVTMIRAAAYAMRARVHADSTQAGGAEKARADYRQSYALYPTPSVAERMGDVEAKLDDLDHAIGDYATAFAFPQEQMDPGRREQLRRKLGSAYVARYQSEKGLGDLVMARYDELVRSLASHFETPANTNATLHDPFDSTLDRLDGSKLRLADYRGKVVVLDFWATWCGPCRVAGQLMERVVADLKAQPDVVFLAANVDEHREGAAGFVQGQKWTIPVAYANGLDHQLGVHALPTFLIFDRESKVVYRQEGLDPPTFIPRLEGKVKQALGQAKESSRD